MSCQSGVRISDIRHCVLLLPAADGDPDTVLEDISDGEKEDSEETGNI